MDNRLRADKPSLKILPSYSRSCKITPLSTAYVSSYLQSVVTVTILYCFWDIQRQIMAGSWVIQAVTEHGTMQKIINDFLSVVCHCKYSSIYTVRHNYRTGPPSFKWHNLINTRFIYIKISANIVEGMLSLQIWKQFVFWLNVLC